jgi:hypothetical protein
MIQKNYFVILMMSLAIEYIDMMIHQLLLIIISHKLMTNMSINIPFFRPCQDLEDWSWDWGVVG